MSQHAIVCMAYLLLEVVVHHGHVTDHHICKNVTRFIHFGPCPHPAHCSLGTLHSWACSFKARCFMIDEDQVHVAQALQAACCTSLTGMHNQVPLVWRASASEESGERFLNLKILIKQKGHHFLCSVAWHSEDKGTISAYDWLLHT